EGRTKGYKSFRINKRADSQGDLLDVRPNGGTGDMGFAHGRPGSRTTGWGIVAGVTAFLFLSSRACADDALPVETLTKLKAATVFLKVESGKVSASGSGFVIRTEGQTVHIVTNNHVLDLTPEGQPRPGSINPVVTVVFNSGGKDEQSVRGEVVAADVRRDLAV